MTDDHRWAESARQTRRLASVAAAIRGHAFRGVFLFVLAGDVALSAATGCHHKERVAPVEDPLQLCCASCLQATRSDPRATPLDDVPCFGIAEGRDVISPQCRDVLRGAGATPASCRGEPLVPPPPSL